MKHLKLNLIVALAFCCSNMITQAQDSNTPVADYLNETREERDARMSWWREARFSMFIHWGVYAVPAGYYEGRRQGVCWLLNKTKMPLAGNEKFAQAFNPEKYDPEFWAQLDRRAGMKYMEQKNNSARNSLLTADMNGMQAVRMGEWKYIDNTLPVDMSESRRMKVKLPLQPELYNLAEDPGESKNMLDQYPEVVKKLSEELNRIRTQESTG